jgi:hypothetical protein
MKRSITLIFVCIIAVLLAACNIKVITPNSSESSGTPVTESPAAATTEPTAEPALSPEPATEPPTPEPPSPEPTVNMYSSYADMVSFNPSTGLAQFDYWDRLRGEEAVDWLVEHEGYSESEAQDIVDDYADSEFIKKNTNPQLRTVDLSSVPVKMLQYPFGYEFAPDPDPILTSFTDLCALYATDPDILLTLNYYYITVDASGTVTDVSQCYQP